MDRAELGRRLLSEFFAFMKFKVDSGGLTLEEETALLKLFEESIPVCATIEDLSGYYGKSETAVRSVISRRLLKKPKRRVMYDFQAFRKIVPDKWKK